MLTRSKLKRINERPRKVNRALLAGIGAGSLVLAALLFVLTSSLVSTVAVLVAGAAGILAIFRTQKTRAFTSVTYGDLQGEMKARFSAVQEGCEALSSSEGIWLLRGPLEQRAVRTGDASVPPPREPARLGLLETPGIRADVPIWGIDAGGALVFFFPEAVLVYRDERYEGVPYESLAVTLSGARFYEKEEVPKDAKVVAEQTSRTRMPVVLYAIVQIELPSGPNVTLQVSSRDAAARFAAAFGVKEGREKAATGREERARSTRAYTDSLTMQERARIASAYTTLGVTKGASMDEVTTAYKRLARVHHPDKVANLEPEQRESSERRMKEINAAYTELKRLRRYPTDGAG